MDRHVTVAVRRTWPTFETNARRTELLQKRWTDLLCAGNGRLRRDSLLYRNVVLNLVITADFSEISRMRAQEITSRWV
jgi:hypothetical protein